MRKIRKVFSEEMHRTFEGNNSLSKETQDESNDAIYDWLMEEI